MLDDDARLLLPPQQPNYEGSEADWIAQSPTSSGCSIDMLGGGDGGGGADESFSEEYSSDSASPPCELSTIERLLHTHPVWFLPDIQRAGAVHLLQSKEHGSFVVRGSSQANTMAVSVRLPPGTGPYIEHYLIQSRQGVLSLETSKFQFASIQLLIAHYSQCCDELPVQLRLPRDLREATNRKQLSSLALLGQEFWRYSMSRHTGAGPLATAATVAATSPNGGHSAPSDSAIDVKGGSGVTSPMSPADTTFNSNRNLDSPGTDCIQVTTTPTSAKPNGLMQRRRPFGQTSQPQCDTQLANNNTNNNNHNVHSFDLLANSFGTFCQVDTPTDTMSSISSFTSAGLHGVVAAASPTAMTGTFPRGGGMDTNGNGNLHEMRRQQQHRMSLDLDRVLNGGNGSDLQQLGTSSSTTTKITRCVEYQRSSVRTRPTPPNTLNLICFEDTQHHNGNARDLPSTSMFSPATDCDTPSSFGGPSSHVRTGAAGILSPMDVQTPSSTCSSFGRPAPAAPAHLASKHRNGQTKGKPARHYQDSAIPEYCRSPLADKFSDYEDLPSRPDSQAAATAAESPKIYQSTLSHGPLMSSFRSNGFTPPKDQQPQLQRPDLLHEIRTVTSLMENILLPEVASSVSASVSVCSSASASSTTSTPAVPVPAADISSDISSQMVYVNPVNAGQQLTPAEAKDCSPFYAEPANSLNTPTVESAIGLQRSTGPGQRSRQFPPPPLLSVPLITKTLATPLPSPLDAERPLLMTQLPLMPQQRPWNRLAGPDTWSLDSTWQFMNTIEQQQQQQQQRKNNSDVPDEDDDEGFNTTNATDDADYDTDEHWNAQPSTSTSHLASRPYPSSTAETAAKASACGSSLAGAAQRGATQTVQQLILARLPELGAKLSGVGYAPQRSATLCVDNSAALAKCFRISSYDNVTDRSHAGYKNSILQLARSAAGSSVHSDDGTVFSEPWDSSQWDTLSMNQCDSSTATPLPKSRLHTSHCLLEDDTITEEETYPNTVIDNLADATSTTTAATHTEDTLVKVEGGLPPVAQKLATIMRSRNRLDRSVLNHPRNKLSGSLAANLHRTASFAFLCPPSDPATGTALHHGAGASIADYAYALAADAGTTFARQIQNFITCTRESRELTPQVTMRNMRQFMSGMKNYLVKAGEGEFQNEVLRARSLLRADEFLNLDQILEGVMHRLVVVPLRQHLYALSVEHYVQAGQIQLLVDNVRHAASRSAADFGIPPTVEPPSALAMQRIALLLQRLQEAELPLDKLSYLLTVVAAIFETANSTDAELGADYFLPLLVYVVAKCEFIGAEVEAEFMYGLLQQSLLTGEAGYYLTALCSAVEVLKGMMGAATAAAAATAERKGGRGGAGGAEASDIPAAVLPPACSSVLRVIIPDELNGSLQTCTLPVRPNTTTKEVCRSIAHKARITNPQDYALFELVNGDETLLTDSECPQESRLAARGQHCLFAYKRIDAKIAWPTLPNNSNGSV